MNGMIQIYDTREFIHPVTIVNIRFIDIIASKMLIC